ncbi:MAG: hypothetical protein HUJ89_02305 [Bacteroidales bacterium]|nr:hypothetical protein [Bacteroidales bacterium]
MALVLPIGLLTCGAIILSVLLFPRLKIGQKSIDTYWLVAVIGAALMLAFGGIDRVRLLEGIVSDSAINPLKILTLFLSMTALSIFLDEVGFFRYAASKALRHAGKGQMRIFAVLYLTVSVLTVFTSNDIIVLTFTPFICYFCRNAGIRPLPYLVAEFIAANTMSMTLIIGNPTNIYIATSAGVDFLGYIQTMILPTLAASAVAFLMLWAIFRSSLKEKGQVQIEKVGIDNRGLLVIGIVHLLLSTLLLAVGPYFGIEMWFVSLVFVFSLVACVSLDEARHHHLPRIIGRTLKRLPWQLVPFVLSMFVIVGAFSQSGLTSGISDALGTENTVWRYGLASFLSANIINNIPMSVLFCSVMEPLSANLDKAVYATVIGSNLGAYLTPIGALAGIMWCSLLKDQGVRLDFIHFARYGVMVSLPTILSALLVLDLVL